MKKNLLVLGPYDRYNYGDLLFPLIIEHELSDYYNTINYYGLIRSDLSFFGGKKTESLKRMRKDAIKSPNCNLLIAGGESLFVEWNLLYSFISSNWINLFHLYKVLARFIGRKKSYFIFEFIVQKIFGGKTNYPFCISSEDYKGVRKVFYNSVGADSIEKSIFKYKKTLRTLYKIDYLSVRSQIPHSFLQTLNINNSLVPDSAILLSTLFSIEDLKLKVSQKILDYVERNRKKYVFFQVNKALGDEFSEIIKIELEKLHNKKAINVCLCPLGIALGHLDQEALEIIDKKITFPHTLFNEVTIWEIMFLIANACLYVGTSLHGAITAMSYNLPYIGLKVSKLDNYLKTWAIKELDSTIEFENICNSAINALSIPHDKLEENRNNQIKLVKNSFNKMKD